MWVKAVELLLGGFFEGRKRKAELKAAKHKRRMDRIEHGDEHASSMDEISAQNRGWKDEYLLLISTIPLVLCFIPPMVPYVTAGFVALGTMPQWYTWVLFGVYIDTFGFRRILRAVMESWLNKKFG